MDLGLSGLASGFDWRSLVNQLADIERAPQRRLLVEQDRLNSRKNAYNSIETGLATLKNKITDLSSADLFDSRLGTSSNDDIATVTAEFGAPKSSYNIDILNLATSSVWTGASNVASGLNSSNDVSGLVLSDAAFYRPVTDGVFSVNGQRIDVSSSDTLQDIFDRINTQTGGDVTATYNSSTDKIELNSSNEIILGSANDTSNFLQLARLYNTGTGSVSSSSRVGSIVLNKSVDQSNLATPISDGGSGAGKFTINGVDITFDASTDAITDILNRINDSSAGVSASFDSVSGKFMLTNKQTGDLGITMSDVTGNFLSATGISSSTLERGQNLKYTINGGGELQSFTNTIDQDSSGLNGISISAKKEGQVSVNIETDEAKIKSAINAFIDDYNSIQSLLSSQTEVITGEDGSVDAAALSGELEANQVASSLRNLANGQITGIDSTFDFLSKFGINSNGDDNKIAITDSSLLDDAIRNNLTGLKEFFTDENNGLASKFDQYLEATVGDEGSIIVKQENLGKQASNINSQIEGMERLVQANRETLISRFIAMESAQARANQQLQFLAGNLG